MSKKLDIYFEDVLVGLLEQDQHGDINFSYAHSWLINASAFQISCSLPLRDATYNRKACRAYFDGLLPEENQRRIIAKNLGISANNDFSMLAKIGGECAGALSFIPHGEKPNNSQLAYREIKKNELVNILNQLPKRPLLAGELGVRLSLAGVQDKLAVYVESDKTFIPLETSPSTHIIKPDFGFYEGVVYNEAFCMGLAKKVGLNVANVEIKQVENIEYLLIERYDRFREDYLNATSIVKRYHQEDFCQAIGVPAIDKYQCDGGPSLKQCFELIRRESSMPVVDLSRLLQAVLYNLLIGNCDAHGKNFSFLYAEGLHLSPLYDLLSTVYYKELDKKMAMKLGGEYHIDRIGLSEIDRLAEDASYAKREVYAVFSNLIEAILSGIDNMAVVSRVQVELVDLIKSRCLGFAGLLKKRA
ncbi:MAG TPA: type II toxin-antitoxin system HipA family toxin [Gammaproteobacteria bacterium]|nr:type II toxin-antitoxin system HipA family toxin [Gammaproteobacteria bacterium]